MLFLTGTVFSALGSQLLDMHCDKAVTFSRETSPGLSLERKNTFVLICEISGRMRGARSCLNSEPRLNLNLVTQSQERCVRGIALWDFVFRFGVNKITPQSFISGIKRVNYSHNESTNQSYVREMNGVMAGLMTNFMSTLKCRIACWNYTRLPRIQEVESSRKWSTLFACIALFT